MNAPRPLTLNLVPRAQAQTLPGLFLRHCERTPGGEARRQYEPASAQWKSCAWPCATGCASCCTVFPLARGCPGVWRTLELWTMESGLVTATMKRKRPEMERRFAEAIRRLYAGHDVPA